jgi:Predicted glycosyltransferases
MAILYILLPVHNRIDITRRFIACLQAQTYQEFQVILIDDGSSDGTSVMIQHAFPSVIILRGNGNWWWGGSLHQGYLWLKSQALPPNTMVLIMNDDAIFDSEYLQTGVSTLQKLKKTLLVSIAYGEESKQVIDGGVHVDWKRWKFTLVTNPEKVNCTSTRGLFFFASDFMDIGGFHPYLLPHYASDYEFTIRAHNKGYKLLVDDQLKLYTNEKTTGIQNFKDVKTYSEFISNLFSKKYTLHPVYLSNFVALACPWQWKIVNWLRIWCSTIWKIVRYFILLVVVRKH